MTYREALNAGAEILENAGVPDPKLDSWYLLEHVCGIKRSEFYLRENDELSVEDQQHFETALKERGTRVPLQYILGTQEFMGLSFQVNSSVLIPRQDTETLVELVLSSLTGADEKEYSILDLGTGSGCIAVSIKKNIPGVRMTASDASKQSLLVAKENARAHGTEMRFIRSDLFDNINERFDRIVSNPPYIKTADILGLEPEVSTFEPAAALDGHEDGLYFYRKIAEAAVDHLNEDGMLFLEIGCDQGKDVSKLLTDAGFRNVQVRKDLTGNDRVVSGLTPGHA